MGNAITPARGGKFLIQGMKLQLWKGIVDGKEKVLPIVPRVADSLRRKGEPNETYLYRI
jgi:hypothetical protein